MTEEKIGSGIMAIIFIIVIVFIATSVIIGFGTGMSFHKDEKNITYNLNTTCHCDCKINNSIFMNLTVNNTRQSNTVSISDLEEQKQQCNYEDRFGQVCVDNNNITKTCAIDRYAYNDQGHCYCRERLC